MQNTIVCIHHNIKLFIQWACLHAHQYADNHKKSDLSVYMQINNLEMQVDHVYKTIKKLPGCDVKM